MREVLKITTLIAIAPQFLVDDLAVALSFYEETLCFRRLFVYADFYAGVERDAARIHLKCAPKPAGDRMHRRAGNHLDAFFEVDDVRALHAEFAGRSAPIIQLLSTQAWGNVDFLVEDPDGYILCFSSPA